MDRKRRGSSTETAEEGLAEASRTMRCSESAEERSEAASRLGQAALGGRQPEKGRRRKEQSQAEEQGLAEAARILRTSPSAEERSRAASRLGRAGGRRSTTEPPIRRGRAPQTSP